MRPPSDYAATSSRQLIMLRSLYQSTVFHNNFLSGYCQLVKVWLESDTVTERTLAEFSNIFGISV